MLRRESRAYVAVVNQPTRPHPALSSLSCLSCIARWSSAAILLLAAGGVGHAADATVERFSPQGVVKQPQQATARFSGPMVPFGDLTDVAPPFEVDCPAKGTSRWLDSVTWAYDFEQPLGSGLRCAFTLRDGVKALDGREVAGARSFEFTTGGPAIAEIRPWPGSDQIDERQIFLLGLDGPADPASVRKHAGFFVDGLPERIEAEIVGDAELEGLLSGMSKWSRPTPPVLALRARRTFANRQQVRLVWDAGIRSPSGEASVSRQTYDFRVRPAFSIDTRCQRENARSGCVPILPVSVAFSEPVARELAAALRLVGPDGAEKTPSFDDDGYEDAHFAHAVEFAPPFAEQAAYTLRIPEGFHDDAGRTLPESGTASTVRTGPMPVLAKFATNFGIVERHAGPALPITLRNIEPVVTGTTARPVAPPGAAELEELYARAQGTAIRVGGDDPKAILEWLRRVSVASRRRSVFATGAGDAAEHRRGFRLPKPLAPRETEVVGLPLEGTGLHIVEIESPLLGASLLGPASEGSTEPDRSMYVAAAALVTNLAVHFQRGREGSLAWVTTLDHAEPVVGARVAVTDCHGSELAAAETDSAGIARFPELPKERDLPYCPTPTDSPAGGDWRDFTSVPALSGLGSGLFVLARTKDDMTFSHSSWNAGIEPWRFQLPSPDWQESDLALHAIFDRPLYRAGETAHMKFVARRRTMGGFTIPPAEALPKKAVVEFTGNDENYEIPVAFDDSGIAVTDWPIPAGAKLGSYSVSFPVSAYTGTTVGSFRVEQFRVPLVRGEVSAPPVVEPGAASLPVDVSVQYLAGGAAAGLPVVLRSELRPGSFDAPEEYEGFAFGSARVREGLDDGDADDEGTGDADAPKALGRVELELDAAGGARTAVANLPAVEQPTDLVLEAEFRDPNGEVETVATRRVLLPASFVPGIRVSDWTSAGRKLAPSIVVLAPDGKPVAGARVRVEAFRRRWFSHRKRLVGGFYAYDFRGETRRIGPVCEGATGADGKLPCEADATEQGQLVLEATVTDPAGREASASTEVWVGGEDSGFEVSSDDRIDLVPEKQAYEPGETARLQVRMPFREATALVTVQREGVGEARVVHLTAEDPVIEVPVRGEHAPNVFVSVLVVRGRVGDVQPTATLDLGRPAFRLGIAELRVDWKTHRLGVRVTSDRETYRVRETARVEVAVTRPNGLPAPAGSEVAIAAVDEGLLELLPNTSWKLLDAMMGRRGYEVETFTAQGQVVGKRHYGRKTVAAGGGGGAASARELFDTLLLWAPRVRLDDSGRARVDVPLNDSLTAFRIVAVAIGGDGEFGDGAATIRATSDLSIFSGLPPLVREGDRFAAEFTLRNTSDRPLDVRAEASVAAGGAVLRELAGQQVALAPGEGRTIEWPLDVPAGHGELAWSISASAGAAGAPAAATDRLVVKQKVVPAHRVEVVQATLAQLDGSSTMPVAAPAGAARDADGSGVVVSAAATLATALEPIREWFERYPYTCLEQRVSIAIGREDAAAWDAIAAQLPSYLDGAGLLKFFPQQLAGDDRLTAYVLSISKAAGRALPTEVESRMVAGLQGFVAGRVVRASSVSTPDRTLRKLSAIEALARAGRADASMLGSIDLAPELWPTSGALDWWSILARVPDVPEAERRKNDVEQILRARLDLSGTTLSFAGESGEPLWWMMASADSNAVRLLLHLVEQRIWKEDAPRVLRGVVARREGGAWQTTVANAWGVVAMRRFAEAYEAGEVAGRTDVSLDATSAAIDWSTPERSVTLPWPDATADLAVRHEGTGKPWITTVARAAVPRTEPVAAGYRIARTVAAVEPRADGTLRRGDRLRVTLDIDAQREMWWVVVDDPVPAGSSHLGGGLGRGAGVGNDARSSGDAEDAGGAWLAFAERSHRSWRGYLQYLPRGHSRLEYLIRVNQAGRFHLPPTRVEALYAPEIFGELPNADVTVEP